MLFLGLFYLIVPKLLCGLNIFISVWFTFMLWNNVCVAISGNYRKLMYITAGWHVLTAITDMITSLAVQNIKSTVVVFDSYSTEHFSPTFELIFFLLRISLIVTGLQMTTFHFIYRCLILKNAKLLKKLFPIFLIIFITLGLLTAAIVATLMYVRQDPDAIFTNFIVETYGPAYGIPNLISGDLETKRMLTTVEGMSQRISIYTFWTHIRLLKLISRMSATQALLIVFFCFPVILAGYFELSVSPLVYTIPSVLMSMSPFFTTLAVIFSTDSLKNCLMAFFCPCRSRVVIVTPYVPPAVIS